jgi:hypothetical protein
MAEKDTELIKQGEQRYISAKTRTFDFQPRGNDEIDLTDKDGDE